MIFQSGNLVSSPVKVSGFPSTLVSTPCCVVGCPIAACAAACAASESAATGAHAKTVVDAWAPQTEDGVHRGGGFEGGSADAFPKPAGSGAADSTGEGERTERGAAAANKLLEAMLIRNRSGNGMQLQCSWK